MDWVAQRRAPLVLQTCPPLGNPGAREQQRLRTWRMQPRIVISVMLLTYWVVQVSSLSVVRIWVTESSLMRYRLAGTMTLSVPTASDDRPPSLWWLFCSAIFAAFYEHKVMSTVPINLCIIWPTRFTLELSLLRGGRTLEVTAWAVLSHGLAHARGESFVFQFDRFLSEQDWIFFVGFKDPTWDALRMPSVEHTSPSRGRLHCFKFSVQVIVSSYQQQGATTLLHTTHRPVQEASGIYAFICPLLQLNGCNPMQRWWSSSERNLRGAVLSHFRLT